MNELYFRISEPFTPISLIPTSAAEWEAEKENHAPQADDGTYLYAFGMEYRDKNLQCTVFFVGPPKPSVLPDDAALEVAMGEIVKGL